MQALHDKLDRIEGRLRALLEELAVLKLKNREFKQENERLKNTIDQQKESLKELEKKLLEAGFGMKEPMDQEVLKVKLAHYIDEIDKCLEMVNSLE